MSVTSTEIEVEVQEVVSSDESSSIGKNSDHDEDDDEAQSRYTGGFPVMEELHHVLPLRKGISMFYDGKSKSFTSLADASASSSAREMVKPENAYARRRRNLLAFTHLWDKPRGLPLSGNAACRGISKRPLCSTKSTLALAIAMTRSESCSSTSDDSNSGNILGSPPPVRLPPLHPRNRGSNDLYCSPTRSLSAWKSHSVVDLPRHTITTDPRQPI